MKRWQWLSVLAVLAMMLQACASETPATDGGSSPDSTPRQTDAAGSQQPQPADPIRVGLVLPLTGANAPGGIDVLNGYEVAAALVNEAQPEIDLPFAAGEGIPCLGGAQIEIVSADSTGDAQRGTSEAERLISEQDIDILGDMYFSSITAAAQPVAEREGIPFLTSNSSSPELSTKNLTWWFRTGPDDNIYTKAMFDFMEAHAAETGEMPETVGLFYEDTLFGQSSSTAQKELAPEYGMEVVADVSYRAQATTLSSEVLRLKDANPDVVLISSFLADSILFYEALREVDYVPPMIIAQGGSPGDPAFIEAVGEDAEGLLIRSAWSPELLETNETVADVAAMFEEVAGRPMGSDAPLAIQGLLVIADALERACSSDPEAVRTALEETQLSGSDLFMPWDGVEFDSTTHQNEQVRVVIRQLRDSVYKTVYPFEIATEEVLYPLASWGER
jgi:branched-chain amino acid transport system substrate-binding protein